MNWTDPTSSEQTKKGEDDMSSFVAGFTARIRERPASSQGEIASSFEVLGLKRLKWASPDGEA